MKKIYFVLHYISKVNTYILCLCIAYFLGKHTIGWLLRLFFQTSLCELIYIILAFIFVKNHVKISSPYQKYLE